MSESRGLLALTFSILLGRLAKWLASAQVPTPHKSFAVLVLGAAGLLWIAAAQEEAGDASSVQISSPYAAVEAGGTKFEFCRIPAGVFWMGSATGEPGEQPVHRVEFEYDFEIGATEVTVRQFKVFVDATAYVSDAERAGRSWGLTERGWERIEGLSWRNPGFSQSEDEPVVCVGWQDATAFCEWFSRVSGKAARLPSEAEWEYACRAGTTSDFAGAPEYMGWDMGWHMFNSSGKTQPVRSKKPNDWGLYDMHGNVWELCQDTPHVNYERAPSDGRAWIDSDSLGRIVRGGGWCRVPESMRSAARYSVPGADYSSVNIGFRVLYVPPTPLSAPVVPTRRSKPRPSTTTAPPAAKFWTNGLGMAFVHVPGTQLRFSIWETRVRDFDAFARTDRYDAEEALTAFASIDGPRRTWRRPGFSQGPDYPVVLVDWESARRFCEWLTRHERLSRRIALTQAYRLPTDAEWNAAVGAGAYPWGDQFPPPSRAGNYAGEEALEAVQSQWFRVLRNYADGHARTAPVGSFPANRLGIHDLGGNVGEWCADWYRRDMLSRELERLVPFRNNDGGGQAYRVVRGASWLDSHPAVLRSAVRLFEFPDHCSDNIGFRVVLETPRP